MSLTNARIEKEVDSLIEDLPEKEGAREVLTAYLQGQNGLPVDQVCPSCCGRIKYEIFSRAVGEGASLDCGCEVCTTNFRGL